SRQDESMSPSHICRCRLSDPQSPFSMRAKCEVCGEDFSPVVRFTCHCKGTVTFFLSEEVEVGANRRCPIYDYEVEILQLAAVSMPRNHRPQEREESTSSPQPIDTLRNAGSDRHNVQPSTTPFLDRTAKIGITTLALLVLLPLLATVVSQIALPSVLL